AQQEPGAAVPGDDPGHVRAVTERIVRLALGREVETQDDAALPGEDVGQVQLGRIDAGVHDRYGDSRSAEASGGEDARVREIRPRRRVERAREPVHFAIRGDVA